MPWLTIPEAAREFEVAPSTMRKWVMEGRCASGVAPDGARIVSPKAVELYLADVEAEAEEAEAEEELEDEELEDEELEDEDLASGEPEEEDEDGEDEDDSDDSDDD